jgi:hypothetical protein
VVAYTDVDEILVADPALGRTVVEALSTARRPVSYAVGLEIIHRTDVEPGTLDPARPILQQRQHFRTTTYHSKPSVVTGPIVWDRGGHFCETPGLHFLEGLHSIHLRFYDEALFRARARSRRLTTKAPGVVNRRPHRRWRVSDEGIESVLDEFRRMKLPASRSLSTFLPRLLMRATFRRSSRNRRMHKYRTWASTRLQRLPERFLDQF